MTLGSATNPIYTLFAAVLVAATLIPAPAAAQNTSAMPRVRSENPLIGALIAEARVLSTTFRALVSAIDGTDGIVYVQSGECGRGARACLVHSVQVAGPYRILRVVVNTRRDREGLIGAIGHELQHALEVLHDVHITTSQGMFFHFFGASTSMTNRFETNEAIGAGARIEHEVWTATRSIRDERKLSR